MKTRGKVLLTLGCAVVLMATTVMGTLAWFTDKDTVTNSFTVGNVKLEGDSSTGLDEAKTNEYGQKVNSAGAVLGKNDKEVRVQANTYKLVPGHSYIKDPTVHVKKGSEDCYLFLTVKDEIAAIEDATTVENQMLAKGWKKLTGATAGTGEVVWYYVGENAQTDALKLIPKNDSKHTDIPVFDNFKVKSTATEDTLKAYSGKNIIINAYAIQADGMDSMTTLQIWNTVYGAYQSS